MTTTIHAGRRGSRSSLAEARRRCRRGVDRAPQRARHVRTGPCRRGVAGPAHDVSPYTCAASARRQLRPLCRDDDRAAGDHRRGQRGRYELAALRVSLEAAGPGSRAGVRRAAHAAARLADVVRGARALPAESLVPRLRASPARGLAADPFPNEPPRYVRATTASYTFTGFAERRETGRWWKIEPRGIYLPVVSL